MTKHKYLNKAGVERFKPSMSEQEYTDYTDEQLGWCLACGTISSECVEPDARRYRCEACEQSQVFGLEELLLMNLIVFEPELQITSIQNEEQAP